MSGVIDLASPSGGGGSSNAPQSYELLDSDSDTDDDAAVAAPPMPMPAAPATETSAARARREAELRAGVVNSSASGHDGREGWGGVPLPRQPSAGGGSRAAATARAAAVGRQQAAALDAAADADAAVGRQQAAAAASAGSAAARRGGASGGGDVDDEDEQCCPEQCSKCQYCASARTCRGREECVCDKVDDAGQSEEERRRYRQVQKQREEEIMRKILRDSMAGSRPPPRPADPDEEDAQLAEAIRQSTEEARLREIAAGPAAGPAAAAGRKRPRPADGAARVKRPSKNARPAASSGPAAAAAAPAARKPAAQPAPTSSHTQAPSQRQAADSRRAAAEARAEAAESRSSREEVASLKQQLARLKQQLAAKDATVARMEAEKKLSAAAAAAALAAATPESSPGSAPTSPQAAAASSAQQQQVLQEAAAQHQQREAALQLQVSRLQASLLQSQQPAADQPPHQQQPQPSAMAPGEFQRKAVAYRASIVLQRKLWESSAKKDKDGVTISVRRDPEYFIKDSCAKIAKLSKGRIMRSPIWFKFDGEHGVDEGGVTREFWSMFGETICPRGGGGGAVGGGAPVLFERVSDEDGASFLPAVGATDDESLELYFGLGILIARMLLDSAAPLDIAKGSASSARPLDSEFGLLCLRYCLWRNENLPADSVAEEVDPDDLGWSDLAVCHAAGKEKGYMGDLDLLLALVKDGHGAESLAASMSALQSMPLEEDTTLGALGLDSDSNPGLASLVLCESEPPTKTHAVIAVLHDKLLGSRRKQFEALRDGFSYAGMDWWKILRMFGDEELKELLWQPAHIDAQSVIAMLHFQSFERTHRTPTWLKSLLEQATDDWLKQFLRWCTGTAAIPTHVHKPPSSERRSSGESGGGGAASWQIKEAIKEEGGGGAAKWQITVQWEPEYEQATRARFPTASTCARTLNIPEYESEEILRERLGAAVEQTAFTDQ